ncbi:hypothetical protein GCM10027521_56700 [Amycolatopsis cihanbeyliensis]
MPAEPDEPTAEEAAEEAASEEPEPARRTRRRLPRPRLLLAVLTLAALLGGLTYAGVQYFSLRADQAARAAALDAASRFATDLSSYDFSDLEGNFSGVTENATGRFAEQYRQVGANLTELIQQHEAVSTGSVLTAGVAEADSKHAVVVLFVDQEITNTNSPKPRIDRNRMRMALVHQEGRWLVDDVSLL